jgi:hypothetical protein
MFQLGSCNKRVKNKVSKGMKNYSAEW